MPQALTLSLPKVRDFKTAFSLKLFRLSLFCFLAFLVVFCVFQLNAQTREYYFIQGAGSTIEQLTQENRALEINFSKVSSLSNLDKYLQNFEKAGKTEYIKLLGGTALAK